MNNRAIIFQCILLCIGAVLCIPFIGGIPLFDWDEINFAEAAREMIVTGDYSTVQINFHPFWEKPPLFFWIQALSMKIFGINEFAARFPNAICGILTLLILFNIGRKVYDDSFGFSWALIYLCSVLPFFYFKSGIIDPWFNLFIFLGIYYFILYIDRELNPTRKKEIIFSAFFIGLGILTKGPVALVLFFLCVFVYLIFIRFRLGLAVVDIFLFFFVLLFVGGFWFLIQLIQGNYSTVVNFIAYQVRLFTTEDAGHGGFFFYHFVILFVGVFPSSVLALISFKRNYYDNGFQKHFKVWMIIIFWVVLILFTLVKTKIVHYSSLCYFPITFLAAHVVMKINRNKLTYKKWLTVFVVITGLLYSVVAICLPFIEKYKERIITSGFIKDKFFLANLQADVAWKGFEFFIGFVLIIGILLYVIGVTRKKYNFAFISIFLSALLFVNLSILYFTPRVEEYTQHAAIEFYQSIKDEDCYVETLGFKSYAHLFYTRKKPIKNAKEYDKNWLLIGKINKRAYFVMKSTKKDRLLTQYPDLKLLYEKNGYVFTVRLPDGALLK